MFVPLEDQDRARWDRGLIERGVAHLAGSATGDHMSRWHLEGVIEAPAAASAICCCASVSSTKRPVMLSYAVG